jgi:DNA-binding MarR family transcriptional regulator
MREESIIKKSNKEFLRHPAESVFNDGYGQTPKSIMCDKSISGTARLIYAYLSSYAGGGNVAFPGTGKLCSDLGISRGTFQKHFKQLENAGYMKRYQIKDERNKFSNNIYEFIYDLPKSNNGDES